MKLYFAPIDGVTGRIYRNAFTKFFVSPDKYFAPFIYSILKDNLTIIKSTY